MTDTNAPMTNVTTMSNAAWQALGGFVADHTTLSPLLPAADHGHADKGRAELVQSGLVDSDGTLGAAWKPALETLARPCRHVTLALGDFDSLATVRACLGRTGNGVYAVYSARSSQAMSLAYPVTAPDLTLPMFETLGLEARTPDLGIGFDLTPGALVALAGMIDAMRETEAEALLARDLEADRSVSAAAVGLAVTQGWASGDSRWLVPIIRQMQPVPVEIDQTLVEEGLAELVGLDLVRRRSSGSSFGFAPDFEMARRTLSAPFAYAILAVTDDAGEHISQAWIGALRTLGALWAFQFVAGKPHLFRIRTLGEADLLGIVADSLTRPHVSASRTDASEVEAAPISQNTPRRRFCTACGQPLAANAKFCSHCGTPV